MPDETFLTLAGPGRGEVKERGSRFLGFAYPVTAAEEVRPRLEALASEHFNASHHCFAWQLRDGAYRASDAGEPSQSAGIPILQAVRGAGLTDVLVVVVRYYGGTKLGVGGLVRAYGAAAEAALGQAPGRWGTPARALRVRYPYALTGDVMRVVDRHDAADISHGYGGSGSEGEVSLVIPAAAADEVRAALREATGGRAIPTDIGVRTIYHPLPQPPSP